MGTRDMSAEEALEKLKAGNKAYITSERSAGDISLEIRKRTCEDGQEPYAVIVSCSDSRVIPESIFNAGIGELFVIRVAGNVIDKHQLGSIEYAVDHLGCPLVVVLGHDRCGAVDAAMHHEPDGHIRYIVDDILEAIGEEKDELKACCLNVRHAVRTIEKNMDIQRLERERGLRVQGALYRIGTGEVEFF